MHNSLFFFFFFLLWALLSGKENGIMKYEAFHRAYSKLDQNYPHLTWKAVKTVLHFIRKKITAVLGQNLFLDSKFLSAGNRPLQGSVTSSEVCGLPHPAHSLKAFPLLDPHYIYKWPFFKLLPALKFSSQDLWLRNNSFTGSSF